MKHTHDPEDKELYVKVNMYCDSREDQSHRTGAPKYHAGLSDVW